MKNLLKELKKSISKFFHPRLSTEEVPVINWSSMPTTGGQELVAARTQATEVILRERARAALMSGRQSGRALFTSTPSGFTGVFQQMWGEQQAQQQPEQQNALSPLAAQVNREAVNTPDSEDLGLVFSSDISPVTCQKCHTSFAILDKEDEAGEIVFCTNPECGEEIELEETVLAADLAWASQGRGLDWYSYQESYGRPIPDMADSIRHLHIGHF